MNTMGPVAIMEEGICALCSSCQLIFFFFFLAYFGADTWEIGELPP